MKPFVSTRRAIVHMAAGLAILSLFAAPASLADEATAPLKSPVGAVEVLSLGTSLVLVVGLILVIGWLYARAQGIRGGNNGAISIVAAQSLGPKERILVVDVAGEQLVLGMTPTQIRTLHVLKGHIQKSESAVSGNHFADRFRDALRGIGK